MHNQQSRLCLIEYFVYRFCDLVRLVYVCSELCVFFLQELVFVWFSTHQVTVNLELDGVRDHKEALNPSMVTKETY